MYAMKTDFNSMKELFQFTQLRNANKRTRFSNESAGMNAGENNLVLKRDAKKSTAATAQDDSQDLSIGVTRIDEIIKGDKIYVDKTRYVSMILKRPNVFLLLVRPSRFGKSLFLNTIEAALLGRRDLFNGTYIEHDYKEWDTKYSVIRLEFRAGMHKNELYRMFQEIPHRYGVVFPPELTKGKRKTGYLAEVIRRMSDMGIKNIALLLDEYDLPLSKAGGELRIFYQHVLRSLKPLLNGGQLKYVVMTGCTSINNLMVDGVDGRGQVSLSRELGVEDISIKPAYHAVCGYTREEIQLKYGHHVKQITDKFHRTENDVFDQIKEWYDGYRFSGDFTQPAVYNPLSIMRYFEKRIFEATSYWYVRNDHSRKLVIAFLEEAISEGSILLDLETELTPEDLFDDIQRPKTPEDTSNLRPHTASLESLLFQMGYLTISSHNPSNELYKLTIPNKEVQKEFHNLILEVMRSDPLLVSYGEEILSDLLNLDLPELVKTFNEYSNSSYKMRVWAGARDKEATCRFMFGFTLMLARGIRLNNVIFEKHTKKLNPAKAQGTDKGDIDIFFQSRERQMKAIIECKYDQKDMVDCMRQAENYDVPDDLLPDKLPVLRVCINFIGGKIERIVGQKYTANGKAVYKQQRAYITRKDPALFPYQCPNCSEAFETSPQLAGHKGYHKRPGYDERRAATAAM